VLHRIIQHVFSICWRFHWDLPNESSWGSSTTSTPGVAKGQGRDGGAAVRIIVPTDKEVGPLRKRARRTGDVRSICLQEPNSVERSVIPNTAENDEEHEEDCGCDED
jgi:hypothetical protein